MSNVQSDNARTAAILSADEAQKIARDAYIFAFPLNYYYRTIHSQIVDLNNKNTLGGFGKWRHDGLATPADKETTMPNNDTPYSWAWVDLRSEPWVLVQPPADGDRFYSSVWGDLWAHIIDYPGSVNDGQKGGVYLLAPTSWKGQVPAGISRVIHGETTLLGTLTRTAVFGNQDIPNMEKIQQGYRLMPLSDFLKQPAPSAASKPDWPLWNEANMTNAEFFRLTNFLMQFVVTNDIDKPIYEQMAKLGIGPNGSYDPAKFSPEIRAAIEKGIAEGHKQIVDGAASAVDSSPYYGTREFMGTRYLDRAVGVEAGGIIPNVPKQAFYGQWTKDASGEVMDGAKGKYTFTFPKGHLPPVRFFWSLTMYDLGTRLLVDNPISRYSIGDRTEGLKRDPDGGLTIYVQKDSPGKDKESNWLPAPAGPMSIISRMYGPDPSILDRSYKFPDPVRQGGNAQQITEPFGGQPPAGSKPSVPDFDYQVKYQRAFEAVLWAMPAAAIYSFRRAAFENLGLKDNDIIAYSAPATPKLEALTANTTTPYIAAYADLQKGPVILEIPAADAQASLYGQVVDAWQLTIADVGPSGVDKGKGGKYLFTPPGYKKAIPQGYFHVASPNYRIAFAFRSVAATGKTADDAYRYTQKLRMYSLSEAGNPPKQRFVDPIKDRYATLPFYDERYFKDIYDIVSIEPVKPQDKAMMGMLNSLGIEKGKPFAPDDTAKRAMRQAAVDAYYYLQSFFDNVPASQLYWPDRRYMSLLQSDANKTFTFVYDDRIDLTARAVQYFWCTYVPKVLSDTPATQYLAAMADKDGKSLEGGKLYKVDVPAEMPVRQFWALTIYDRATFAFIYSDSGKTTLSSYDLDKMKKNADGGVTLYVGPNAPAGLESNWLPTAGKKPLPTFRYYGPTDALHKKTFKMPDFEAVT